MSSFILKIIAVTSMLIDHIGFGIFPQYQLLRIIGRIAMPIFCFQIAIGYKKTSSKPKYFLRMLVCALISQIPFSLLREYAYLPKHGTPPISIILKNITLRNLELNICFTFLIALGILWLLEKAKESKFLYIPALYLVILSIFVPMDYGILGVIWVIVFYYFGEKKWLYSILLGITSLIYICVTKTPMIQLYMLLSLPLIYLHNGEKGKGIKYFFYVFYPLHMLLIVLAKIYLFT